MGCMGCTISKSSKSDESKNNGCASGGCNRLNTFDWLTDLEIFDSEKFNIAEVSFKNGARKGFYRNPSQTRAVTGDMVVVETNNGFDIGRISLSGDLVRLQMKKKRISENLELPNVVRRANERDLDRLQEVREQEKSTMVRARVIARTLDLGMKIGDVEFQGDKRKATFFYTADGRVDFRELIRHFAKEFHVKIEMRQIGARQESARIGGLGSCGRELCCSTWLTDFRSVSTGAARYQNLAINQAKLSGQCGRLKCCLNYELDNYVEALNSFPDKVEKLKTQVGTASLIKIDIFKKIMYYAYDKPGGRGKIYSLKPERVLEIKKKNSKGEFPAELMDRKALKEEEEALIDFGDVTGVVELPPEEKRKRNKRRKKRKKPPQQNNNNNNNRRRKKRNGPNTKKGNNKQ